MRSLFAICLLALFACHAARPADATAIPPLTLVDTAGTPTAFPGDLTRFKATVVIFYADHCPCFHAHEDRVRKLAADYPGVRVMVVDSEVEATPARDAKASAEHGLPPITLDPGAKLADAIGAEYATFSVVFDADGRVRYRGGFDSDKNQLHEDAKPFVRDALDDILAGRDPRVADGKTLGCALTKH